MLNKCIADYYCSVVLTMCIFSTVVGGGTERRKSDTGITLPTLRVSLIQDMRYAILFLKLELWI